MPRHGWSCQVPVRQALERDEDAVRNTGKLDGRAAAVRGSSASAGIGLLRLVALDDPAE
jgi:hypothetical protein